MLLSVNMVLERPWLLSDKYMEKYKEFFKADCFAMNAGVELIEVKPGYAKARMLVTPDHLNAGGVCQGGALFTLADLAFAAAANTTTS